MSGDKNPRVSSPATGSGNGRALRCDEARVLLMGYLDGELEPAEAAQLEDHLAVCVRCRREEAAFRKLGEVTEEMASEEIPSLDIDAAWATIYRRLERSVGWILLSVGLILLTGWGAWELLDEFLLNPDEPVVVRLGVGAAIGGVIVLLMSIGREVLTKYRSERYRGVLR